MRQRLIIVALGAVLAIILVGVLANPLVAQNGSGRAAQQAKPVQPTPRTADGRVIWGALPGHSGVWNARSHTMWDLDEPKKPGDPNAAFFAFDGFPGKLKWSQVPFQPWARELSKSRIPDLAEPYTRCKPSGGARSMFTPYGTEFLDFPEQNRFIITLTGGPHSFRIIYMDGRPHPTDLEPSYFGHSIGHFEGDTLVIDTVGFNERFWFDQPGSPHTEQLHLIERLTRVDFNTIKYELTVDDPGAYTATWSGGFMLTFAPDQESFEFICQDNVKTAEINGLTSRVTP
jgi:hypothetical protein